VRRLAVLGGAASVLLALALAQLLLPGIAARSLRDRLDRSGRVLSVQVSAFPAIELLWHDADRVVVRLAGYRSSSGNLDRLLDETAGVGSIDASARVLHTGLLTLRDVSMRKRGDRFTAGALLTDADLRRALPILSSVSFVSSSAGTVTLRGTATLLGISATVPATLRSDRGRLVVAPDVPFGSLATVTVFSDPNLAVRSVSGARAPGGVSLSARGVSATGHG